MTLSETEINNRFSAVKEHGEAVATSFKAFVKSLDDAIPAGVAKTKLVNALEEASGWAHHALAAAETEAKNLAHQKAKSGVKPDNTTSAATPAPATITPTVSQSTTSADLTQTQNQASQTDPATPPAS
jgi:hypothetical protein